MSDREGPETKVKRSCLGCKYERYERYQVQGVLCTHPSLPQAKHIADTSWNTPDWCPFLTAPVPDGATQILPRVQRSRETSRCLYE